MDTPNTQAPEESIPEQQQPTIPPSKHSHKSTFIVILAVFIFVIFGLTIYILTTNKYPPPSPALISPTLSQPSPTPGPTENWKTYQNNELSFKYPGQFSSFTCTIDNIDKNTDYDVGIDLTVDVLSKKVDCSIGAQLPRITIGVIGEQTTIEEYLNEIPVGADDKLSEVQYSNYDKITVGYTTRSSSKSNTSEIIYGISNNSNGKIYNAIVINTAENKKMLDQILSTFKFTDQGQLDISNWKTYTNTKYGYSIKYPQELNIGTRVESLPGNEEQRKLPTTCCIGIYNVDRIILGVDAFEEKRTLEQYKNELLSKDSKDVSNLRTIKILDEEALEYNFTSNKIVTLINNNTLYSFLYVKGENYLADQILSTFQFIN